MVSGCGVDGIGYSGVIYCSVTWARVGGIGYCGVIGVV